MAEPSCFDRVGALVDTIESNLARLRFWNKDRAGMRGRLPETDPTPWMMELCDSLQELIVLSGYENVPSYFAEMVSDIRRAGSHPYIETHYEGLDEWGTTEYYELETPPIFKDLARLRYTLPRLAERNATTTTHRALKQNRRAAREYICANGPVTAQQIADYLSKKDLSGSHDTVRKWCAEGGFLYRSGVRNIPGSGYVVESAHE